MSVRAVEKGNKFLIGPNRDFSVCYFERNLLQIFVKKIVFGILDWWNYLMNHTYEDWRLGSLEIASEIWGRPFHVNCSDFQWDCFHLSQKIKVHEIFLAKDTRETFMCPIAELTWVSTQGLSLNFSCFCFETANFRMVPKN